LGLGTRLVVKIGEPSLKGLKRCLDPVKHWGAFKKTVTSVISLEFGYCLGGGVSRGRGRIRKGGEKVGRKEKHRLESFAVPER